MARRIAPRLGGLAAVGAREGSFHLHRSLVAYGLRRLRPRRGGAARLGRVGCCLLWPLPWVEGSEDLSRCLNPHAEHLLLGSAYLPSGVYALRLDRTAVAFHPRRPGRVPYVGGCALRRARLRDTHGGTCRLVLHRAFP